MGSHCTQLQKEEEMQSTQHPIFTAKLGTTTKLENIKPCTPNDSILGDITTERNMQESIPQNQLLSRRYFDDTQTINKTNKLVYSQNIEVLKESQNINLLSDLGVEVESQKEKKEKKKQVEEEDVDYDAMCKQNWDQVGFKAPEAMSLIDKQQALSSSIQLKRK